MVGLILLVNLISENGRLSCSIWSGRNTIDKQQKFIYSFADCEPVLTNIHTGRSGFAVYYVHINPVNFFVPEPPYSTNLNRIMLQLSGKAQLEHKFNGRYFQGKFYPGSFTILPGRRPSYWRWDHPANVILICFYPSFLAHISPENGEPNSNGWQLGYLFNGQDPLIKQIGRSLSTELPTRGPLSRLYAESLVYTFVTHIFRNYSKISIATSLPNHCPDSHQFRGVREYIQRHLGEKVSLSDLASLVGLSICQFSRKFKRSFGLSPHKYLIRCRVERAKSLLQEGSLTIAEIAQEVGFADQSHLTNQFQRAFGVTPAVVLQNAQNIQSDDKNFQDGDGGFQYSNYQ